MQNGMGWNICITESSNLLPGSTPSNTSSELRPELAGGTTLLLSVVVALATGGTVCAVTAGTWADGGWAGGTRGPFVGGGDDLGGEVEPGD